MQNSMLHMLQKSFEKNAWTIFLILTICNEIYNAQPYLLNEEGSRQTWASRCRIQEGLWTRHSQWPDHRIRVLSWRGRPFPGLQRTLSVCSRSKRRSPMSSTDSISDCHLNVAIWCGIHLDVPTQIFSLRSTFRSCRSHLVLSQFIFMIIQIMQEESL